MKKGFNNLVKLFVATYFMKDMWEDFNKSNRNNFSYRANARKAFNCAEALILELNENETSDRLKYLEEQSPIGNC